MTAPTRPIYQPLHPSLLKRLDPEYVAFHNAVLQYLPPSESKPWSPSSRLQPSPFAKTQQRPVHVGSVEDRDISTFQVRIFTPEGHPEEEAGWPALLWFHGGGWVNGGLASENGFLRHVCKYLRCVVVSANYRHAPEHVYPAAIDDAFSALRWLTDSSRSSDLRINLSRLAIGGLSAGGQLASSTCLKAIRAKFPIQPTFLLLLCPVIDSTATTSTTWSSSQHSPFLTPSRMTWYQNHFFPDPSLRSDWTASPNYALPELLESMPKTYMAIAGCDLLAPEDFAFAEQLRAEGVDVETKVYEGATHSVLMLAGIHATGKRLVHDACKALAEALGCKYDEEEALVLEIEP